MSFLIDPFLLILFGLVVSKINYLTLVFDDSLFTRGSRRNALLIFGSIIIALFWGYSSLLYLDLIYFPWPFPYMSDGSDWMLNSGLPLGLVKSSTTDVIAIIMFATYPLWFYLGVELGLAGEKILKKQRITARNRILTEIIRTAIPRGGAIPPSASDVDALRSVIEFIDVIPSSLTQLLTILLFVFDSHFFVFVFTRKWKRFVDLDEDISSIKEKRRYMEAWESNPHLSISAQLLKILSSFGYYTKKDVWKHIKYEGPLIPNDPPWFKRGSEPNRTNSIKGET